MSDAVAELWRSLTSDFSGSLSPSVVATIALLVIVVAARLIIIRTIELSSETLSETRRRWISLVGNVAVLLIVFGLVFIWSPQLSTFALSLAAFAAALAIATKEYLLCIIGALYRTVAQPFSVGDWIEVHGIRGEVLSEGMLTTRLQELGAGPTRFEHTGRMLTLPNSILLSQTLSNEGFRKRYLHHQFTVTLESSTEVGAIQEPTLEFIRAQLSGSEALAERYRSMVRRRIRTELPSREPRVLLETSDLGKIRVNIVIFCATSDAKRLESAITAFLLEQSHAGVLAMQRTQALVGASTTVAQDPDA